jgi:CubicO group peptidase (beta-lactamase class C family)
MSPAKLTLLLIALICLTFQGLAQNKAATIDALLTLCTANGQFNGSALVAENGKVVFTKGYGMANFDWGIPNAPDTKHRIASITKQFTAMLIMQLVEKGKVKIEGKITDYLPEYRKDTGDKVTIHHLLTHTSGIPSYTGLPNFWSDSTRNPYPLEYMVKNFCSGDLEFEPGTKYAYNNGGYYILGAIIERLTGKPYEQVLQENILTPVGMTNSGIDDERKILPNRSQGYWQQGDVLTLDPYFHMTNAYAAGAMYSTAEDLYKWDQALYTDKLISKKTRDIYLKPYFPSGGSSYYGYGWGYGKNPIGNSTDSVNIIQHYGGINGYNTVIFRVPQTKDLVVLLNNTGGKPLGAMCTAILGILHGKPFSAPKLTIADTLLAVIKAKGIEAGMKLYEVMKTNASDKYSFAEVDLNTLGYLVLRMDRVKDAIKIFQKNVELFPEAFNTYDSLGEAYMVDGQKELAIKNYAKSLELNPGNSGAITMLKRIQEMK